MTTPDVTAAAPLVFLPTEGHDTWIRPEHVAQVIFHAGRNDLRLQLVTGAWLRVDGVTSDLSLVLLAIGYPAVTA
jgi:hypothetical protein